MFGNFDQDSATELSYFFIRVTGLKILHSVLILRLIRLTAVQKKDLYDLMVTDRKIAERENYGTILLFYIQLM